MHKELQKDSQYETDDNKQLCSEILKEQEELLQYLQYSLIGQLTNEESL
jgi:hypothetical protein